MSSDTQHPKVYQALCMLLSGQAAQIDWAAFSPADWNLLPRIAQNEGAAPMLYSILERAASDGQPVSGILPPAAKAVLTQGYYVSAAFNALLCRELDGILATLTRAGVPVILLKGTALIKTIYADSTERPMNDLDLLVHRDHIRPAVRALQAAGYQRLMDNYIRYHVLLLDRQAGRVSVELHWSLVLNDQRFPALVDWFWRQSEPLDPANPLVLTLTPTAQLLYLAAHLALQHTGQARLIWYYDLYRLITRLGDCANDLSHIDWDDLLQQASQVSWAEALLQALDGAQARFGFALPDGFHSLLQEQARLQSDQAGRMVGSPAERRSRSVAKTWGGLSTRDRLRMAWNLLLPRPAYLRWRYHPRPAWLWPLCYLRRWGEMFHQKVDG